VRTFKYAGIGSRETPGDVIVLMAQIARAKAREGWVLRSGGADGADSAFERGCRDVNAAADIFYPWRKDYSANASPNFMFYMGDELPAFEQALELASQFHPAWHRCSPAARKLHARNGFILLGPELNDPVDRIYCWTPGAAITGGTGQALRIASHYNIAVRNLADPEVRDQADHYLRSISE
jgi:hypothetical protein